MKLSEKINIACEKGLYPIIKLDDEKIIVSPHKDDEGIRRDSNFQKSVSACKNFLGACRGYSKPAWDKKEQEGAELIGYYTPEVIPYKVGDMVDINSDLLDKYYHGSIFQKQENLKIAAVFENKNGLNYSCDGKQLPLINHSFLSPHFPTKVKEVTMNEVIEKFGEEVKIIN